MSENLHELRSRLNFVQHGRVERVVSKKDLFMKCSIYFNNPWKFPAILYSRAVYISEPTILIAFIPQVFVCVLLASEASSLVVLCT